MIIFAQWQDVQGAMAKIQPKVQYNGGTGDVERHKSLTSAAT